MRRVGLEPTSPSGQRILSAPRLPIPPPPPGAVMVPAPRRRRARAGTRRIGQDGAWVCGDCAARPRWPRSWRSPGAAGAAGAPARPRPRTGPGAGRPAVRLATKDFTEQFVLGELYRQALTAQGFTVELKQDVGSSELVDQALRAGHVDLYPEYTGVIVGELAHERERPASAADTYARAKAFEARRGMALLRASPGSDVLANAVTPAFARRHRLRTTADLRRVGALPLRRPAGEPHALPGRGGDAPRLRAALPLRPARHRRPLPRARPGTGRRHPGLQLRGPAA